jgi:hypothetical protein
LLSLSACHVRKHSVQISKSQAVLVKSLSDAVSCRLLLEPSETVFVSNKALILGQRYSKGNIVVLGKSQGMLDFCVVSLVVWKEKTAYLLIQKVKTVGFKWALNAYLIEPNSSADMQLLDVSELLDFHPLDSCIPFQDHDVYVRPRYLIY